MEKAVGIVEVGLGKQIIMRMGGVKGKDRAVRVMSVGRAV